MALLDCAMAVRASRAAGEKLVITTRYEADCKRKIKAPWVVLCRAWLDRRVADGKMEEDGNKEWGNGDGGKADWETMLARSRVEDGMGDVYFEAKAGFAKRRERGKAKL